MYIYRVKKKIKNHLSNGKVVHCVITISTISSALCLPSSCHAFVWFSVLECTVLSLLVMICLICVIFIFSPVERFSSVSLDLLGELEAKSQAHKFDTESPTAHNALTLQ